MIDAVMYGVMPRAKTERRRRAPPENMSRNPRSPPALALKNSSSAWASSPGVGMCAPTR